MADEEELWGFNDDDNDLGGKPGRGWKGLGSSPMPMSDEDEGLAAVLFAGVGGIEE